MKKIFAGAVVLLIILCFILTGCTSRGQKMGVIDVSRVLEESQRALEYQKQLDERKTEVQQQLEKELGGLKEEERVERFQKAYQELDQLGRELGQKLNQEIQDAIEKVAREKKLEIVINKKAVLYGGNDITEEVIKELGGTAGEEQDNQDVKENTKEQDNTEG